MPSPGELSSLAFNLEELTKRVTSLAESAANEADDEQANELFAVERALQGALRRLNRLTAPRRGR